MDCHKIGAPITLYYIILEVLFDIALSVGTIISVMYLQGTEMVSDTQILNNLKYFKIF